MNADELKEFRSWVVVNAKRHLTGTQLNQIEKGAYLYAKFKEEKTNKKEK